MSAFKDKALPFIKSYGVMIGLGVLALIALPACFFFAQQMNTSFTEKVQKEVSQDFDQVTKADVNYSLPGLAGGTVLEKKAPYNEEMIQWYADRWKETKDKTGVVWDKGLAFNKDDHALLVQGLFPAPADLEKDVKIRELIGAVIAFHAKLLAQAKAGSPPDPAQLATQLQEYSAAYIEKIKAQGGVTELPPPEKEKLGRELVDVRVDRCRKRATEINVYADGGLFDGIPTEVPTKAPTLAQAWDLQERSWINADLMRAVAAANQSTENGVIGAVVKRLLKFSIKAPTYDPANPLPQAYDPGEERAPVDLAKSITGRIGGAGSKNKWYDVRDAELDVIISSQRLPEFIDALAATNFMSVLDVSLSAISPRDDLRAGYFYGDENVVHAHIRVETVLLREWRKDWMPDDVKKALGMVEGVTGPETTPAGGGSAPPRGGPGAGGKGGRGGGRPN